MEHNKNKTMATMTTTMTTTSSNDISTLFVRNLPRDITQSEFRDFFSQFGKVLSYSLTFNPEGLFRGLGCVTFMDPQVAKHVAKLGSIRRRGGGGTGRLVMRGKLCKIKLSSSASSFESTIFVGDLPLPFTNGELFNFFQQFGTVRKSKIVLDREGVSRGFGFVTFADPEVTQSLLNTRDNAWGMTRSTRTITNDKMVGRIVIGGVVIETRLYNHNENKNDIDMENTNQKQRHSSSNTVTNPKRPADDKEMVIDIDRPLTHKRVCRCINNNNNNNEKQIDIPPLSLLLPPTIGNVNENEKDDTLLVVDVPDTHTLYVEGIPFGRNEKQVRHFFEKTHSDLKISDIIELQLPERLRGIAFVTFASQESYNKALTLSGKYMGRRYLTIRPAIRNNNGGTTTATTGEGNNDNKKSLNQYQPQPEQKQKQEREREREHSSTIAILKRPVSSLLSSLSQSNLLTHKKTRQCSNNNINNKEEKNDSPSSPVPSKEPSPSTSLLSLVPDLVVKRMNTIGENTLLSSSSLSPSPSLSLVPYSVEEKVVVETNREMTLLPSSSSSSSSSDTKNHDANDINANDRDYNNNNKYAQLLKKHEKLKEMYHNKMKQNRQLEIECKDLQARVYEEGSLSNYKNKHREWDQQQQQQMIIESLQQKLVQADQQWNKLSNTTSKQTNTIHHMVAEKQIILQRLEDEVMIRHQAEHLFEEEKMKLSTLLEKEISQRCQAEQEQEIMYKQLQYELKKRQTVEQEKYVLLYQQHKGDHPTKKEEDNIVKNEKYP